MKDGPASGIFTPRLTSLPGRYAKALFEVAEESGQTDAILMSLKNLQKIIYSSKTLSHALENPTFSRKAQAAVLNDISVHVKAPPLLQSFVKELTKGGRLACLPQIIDIFQGLSFIKKGDKKVMVTTAHSLTLVQKNRLKDKLKQVFKCPLHLTYSKDSHLKGGVKIRIGSHVIDATLAAQLNQLAAAMKGNR